MNKEIKTQEELDKNLSEELTDLRLTYIEEQSLYC